MNNLSILRLLFLHLSCKDILATNLHAFIHVPTTIQKGNKWKIGCSKRDNETKQLMIKGTYSSNEKSELKVPNESNIMSQPTRFLRIKPTKENGKRKFELQTAVQTFEKQIVRPSGSLETVTVDLHAQVHFGEDSYFTYFNNDESFSSRYDRVHYELIVDESLLTTVFSQNQESTNGRDKTKKNLIRTLLMPQNGLMPSSMDTQTALQYNLSCQVDIMDYSQPNWVCADLSREEFASMQKNRKVNKANNFPSFEVFDALLRPTTPASSGIRTQLFSNLFLQGDGIASFFRSLLWTTVPSPELSVMLLDWSSSSPRAGGISQIASPVLESIISGHLGAARKLVFSQMLVSGQVDDGATELLIGGRNDHALRVLMHSIEKDQCKSNALVYGALHCRDLQKKLTQLGFQRKDVEWRTAWSVDVPGGSDVETNLFATVGAIGVPLYLAIGGFDWVETIEELIKALEVGNFADGFLSTTLYIARHVALYLGLAKFVIEWDGNSNGWRNTRR